MANTRSSTSSTANSRKPRTAARSATTRRALEVEPEPDEQDVAAADAQEIEAEGHYVTADLCGEDVRIVPPAAWRLSWQRMLTQGMIDGFAKKVLHPDDFDFFIEVDPTNEEFHTFIADAGERSGESLGKSVAPSRSGRPIRRR